MRKTINIYILREIAVPFIMVLFVLTFVLLMGRILQLMDLMVNKGIGFIDIAIFIILLMPSFLMFTIPISLLVAILIGLGRLSGDNEITVMKASGISMYQLYQPVAAASVVAFIMTAATTLFLVPQGNYATKHHLYDVSKKRASIGIREKVFIDDFKGLLIYAETIPMDGAFMESVLISDTRLTQEPSTIVAKKAYLISDPKALTVTMRLENGSTHTVDAGLNNYRKMDFRSYDVNLDIGSDLFDEKKLKEKTSGEMTVLELQEKLQKAGLDKQQLREAAIELNKKLSIPMSCLVFGILGVPLGIRAHRSVKSRGISIGAIIVAVYYMLQLGGEALVQTGKAGPAVGAWTPNLVFGLLGIVLFVTTAKEVRWPFPSFHELFRRRQKKNGATTP
ncbi:MAG: LPS export ABC transporter permease LptF [Deltaproteobacteria bacterium HGW-Deltaproteobacteria-9]|nr:MAG: LPS export ABC transporter permease LptF [Deltaproteobacteria bacterium HGW-Deltaproteobacteria-9]